jgi:MYXO-CTERM domain-containing protein
MMPTLASASVPTEPGDLQNQLEDTDSCAPCHAYPNGAQHQGEPIYSPMGWQGSMMANAARDPIFWAGVAIASQDDPTHTEDCVRCHSPRAFLGGRGDAISVDELLPNDLDSIDCDLCHRMIDDGETPPGNARYVIDDISVNGQVPKRGPFSYGVDMPPHPWTDQGDLQASSELCGTCHDVTTARERVDDDGVGMGTAFNEQRTYSEWLNSAFSQPGDDFRSCQDCHMPAIDDAAGCGDFENEGKVHATGVRRHDLVGANRFMTEVIMSIYGDAGTGDVYDGFYEHSLERMDEFIQTAATLDVDFPGAVDLADGFALPVTVTNETGHKLPSGYSEGRVMWVEVTASYGDEQLWSSGYWDGQQIEDDGQVRRYEAIAEDYDDGATFHLLRNNHWVSDTRIPPRGLSENIDTDPVGDRYTAQAGTWPNTDAVDYAFGMAQAEDQTPADTEDDELTIRVRLMYLINTPEYVDFLAEENVTNDAGTKVQQTFDDLGGAQPVVLAMAEATVPLSGLDLPDPSDTSTDGADTDSGDDAETGGATGSDDGGGGCGCTSTTKRDPTGPLSLLAIGLLALCRRRR